MLWVYLFSFFSIFEVRAQITDLKLSIFLMCVFNSLNFFLSTNLLCLTSSRFVFHFHVVQCIFSFPFRLLYWSVDYLETCCLVSHIWRLSCYYNAIEFWFHKSASFNFHYIWEIFTHLFVEYIFSSSFFSSGSLMTQTLNRFYITAHMSETVHFVLFCFQSIFFCFFDWAICIILFSSSLIIPLFSSLRRWAYFARELLYFWVLKFHLVLPFIFHFFTDSFNFFLYFNYTHNCSLKYFYDV